LGQTRGTFLVGTLIRPHFEKDKVVHGPN